MKENWMECMTSYFAEKKKACEQQMQRCRADLREDEAVFARIRGNVYDAFAAVFSVAVQQGKGDDEKVKQFFCNKLKQIPMGWHTSLELARQHGDEKKAYLEEIKLETVGEIEKMFGRLEEDTP